MDNNREVKKKSFLKNWNINYLSNNFNKFIKSNSNNKNENNSAIKTGISSGTVDNTSKNDYNLMNNNIHITNIREMSNININNIKNIRPDYYGKGYSTAENGNNNTCIKNHKYNNYNSNSNDTSINFIHTNDRGKTHMNFSDTYNKINFQNFHQNNISSNVETNVEDNKNSFSKSSFNDMNSIKENSNSYNKRVYKNLHNCNNNNNSDTMNTQYNINYNKCTIDGKNNIKIESTKYHNNSNTESTNNNVQSRNKYDINNEYCMNKNRLINNSECKNNTINLNDQGNKNNDTSNNNDQISFKNNRSYSVSSMVSSNSSIPSSAYSGQPFNYSQIDRINQKKHKISRIIGSNDNNVNKRNSSVSHNINNNSNDLTYNGHENSHFDWNKNEKNNTLSEEQASKNAQTENYNIYRSELNKNISTYTSNDRNATTGFTQNCINTNSSTNTSSETRQNYYESTLNNNRNSGYGGHDDYRRNCKDARYSINYSSVNTNTENKRTSIFRNNNNNSNNNNKGDSENFTDSRRGLNQYSQEIDTKYSRFSNNNAYSENNNNYVRMSTDRQGNSGREEGGDDRYDRRDRYEKRGERSNGNNGQGNEGGDSDGGSGDNNGQGNREGDSDGDSDEDTNRKNNKNRRKESSMDDEVEKKNNNSLNLDMLNPEERKREAEKYKVLGNQSYKLGYFESAIDYYTKAIQYDNTNHVYFTNRALCYKKQKLWKLANIDARQALNLEEESVKAHFILGLTLLHLNSLEEGLKKLTKAKTLSSYLKDSNESEINRYILQAKKLIYLRDEQTKQLKYAELQSFFIEKINLLNQMGYITNEEKFLRTEQTEDLFKEILGTFQKKQIPDYLCCKISMCLMNEPVITPSGMTYDKIFLYEHVKHNGSFDPVSREQFSIREVIPNYAIKEATDNFLKTNPWAFEE
ncbi:hypothetical protein YYC_02729 [Plasmodium yoelii 17X]|uniref:E3 ubiquitin-protein ligase CHIP n=1 Tax=Plasmodium yoelii 17X TaxID=1323249 RepID=V7PLI2_PLAYE|nr:hypothetical protein YYC_02729 [Plasmodium yoelii 17X]